MFNLQTPERIVAAARLVHHGRVFAMNWEQDKPNPALFSRGNMRHTVMRKNPDGHHGDDVIDNLFPQASSQWDGLSHVGDFEHGFWGGVTVQQLRDEPESGRLGIHHWAKRGIVGRAVLLDGAGHRATQGRPLDAAGSDAITVEDLEATRAAQGLELKDGDIWLVRTGWVGWYEQQPNRVRMGLRNELRTPGLECSEAMAEYIFDHHPCALAADCQADGVYEGLFTSAPLNIPNGVGSPPNALVIK